MNIRKAHFTAGVIALCAASSAPAAQRAYYDKYHEYNNDVPYPQSAAYYDEVLKGKGLWEMSFEEWFNGPHALTDVFGTRTWLETHGIVPDVSYTGNFAGNPVGGRSRGATNTSSVNLGYGVDFGKLFGNESLSKWSLGNTWVWRFGDSLSGKKIGNAFPVQQNYGGQTIHLQSLFLQYSDKIFSDIDVLVKFGRFAAGDNFLSKPIYWMYMSNGIDGNPKGIFNQMKWSAYPGSTWGAFLQLENPDGIYFKTGVYQINSDKQDSNSAHGLDWSFKNAAGVNANFEAGWNINHDDSGESPGNISVGYAADWYSAQHLSNPDIYSHYTSTIYIQADYMIVNLGRPERPSDSRFIQRDKKDAYRDLRGIVLWGVIQYNPYDDTATMPLFLNGGVLFNGLIPSRIDDVIALGVVYGKFSNQLTDQRKGSYEVALEANYKLQINRFMYVQPDIQYIINTNGGEYPNALVLGAQFGVKF